jgi:hypothetical protein
MFITDTTSTGAGKKGAGVQIGETARSVSAEA